MSSYLHTYKHSPPVAGANTQSASNIGWLARARAAVPSRHAPGQGTELGPSACRLQGGRILHTQEQARQTRGHRSARWAYTAMHQTKCHQPAQNNNKLSAT